MLEEIRTKLEAEIERLTHELNRELPDRIQKAVELGDLRENSEYKSALERQQFVQARLGHLSKRASELSKIDVEDLPTDRVGFGSRLRVRVEKTDEEIDYTIVSGDFMDLEAGHISLASPLARGLLGAQVDEVRTVQLPAGERTFRIVDLVTLPQQVSKEPEES